MWSHRTLGRFFTWELSVQDGHRLLTVGPYAIVRHPSYLGLALLAAGNVLAIHGSGSWLAECEFVNGMLHKTLKVAFSIYWAGVVGMLFMRMNREDAILRKQFGSEWQAWARRTPYQLIPFVY